MKKIRFGIIGCGRIGTRHTKWAAHYGELVGVCDIDHKRVRDLADQYECQEFLSIGAFAKAALDMDCVAVCTPNGLHAEHAKVLLTAGYHVLCEKPMALHPQDCVEMIRVAEAHNRRLFIVKQNRYNPPVAAVKQAIEEGKFGRILSVQLNCFWNRNPDYFKNSWKGTYDLDGGVLYTQFSHFIDLLYWMFGEVGSIQAYATNVHHEGLIEFEDQGVVILEFLNGALGSVHFTINACRKNMEGSLTVFGERGTVKIGGQYLNELEYQQFEDYEIKNLPPGNRPNDYGTYHGSMSNHDKVYENVVDVLLNGGVIGTSGIEGLKTVEIIDRIYREARR